MTVETSRPAPQPANVWEPRLPNSRTMLRYTLPSLALVGTVSMLELLRHRFQHSHTYFPSKYPTGIWDPSVYGVTVEDVWFESEDGVALHGWWMSHPKPTATLVFCHGNTGSIGDWVGLYPKLLRLKVNLFVFDYRGYGRSAGEPREDGLFSDVRAALDYVHEERQIDWSQLILFGHSLGGAVATDGALHRPVAGLVVQASFTQTKDMARVVYPNVPVHLFTRNQFRSIEKVPLLDMPKLFIHGTEDGTIPYEIGRRLYAAAADPKDWYEVPRAGHNDVDKHGSICYFRRLRKFFKDCVAQGGV